MDSKDPLAKPANPDVARNFAAHFELPFPQPPTRELLSRIARAFATLPYENLSKIIRGSTVGTPQAARRIPGEVVNDHVRLGTGGTCFSLTAALLHIVRAWGWRAEPILADRHYGADTHCALLVWVDGAPHLLDPGYLIVDPVVMPQADGRRLTTSFNEVLLLPSRGGDRCELHTIQQGSQSHRLTFKTEPADPAAFLRAWDASFDWDMMRYPVLTRCVGEMQLYLHKGRLQLRGHERLERREIAPQDLPNIVVQDFGVAPGVVARALTILQRRGEQYGTS